MPAASAVGATPEHSSSIAVAVQTTMVSMNTDRTWTRPCLAGWDTPAEPAAQAAAPMPASLENRPRLMPCMRAEPTKPPKMAWKLKALRKMLANTAGMREMWVKTTKRVTARYSTPITGTSTAVMLAICLPPPLMQTRNTTASTMPTIQGVRVGS